MTDPTDPVEQEVELEEEDGAAEEAESDDLAEDEESDAESDEDEEGTEPELIDVEYGGKTYKVHPDLRDGIMFQADYTRKTQEVAEQRRALEARITEANEASDAERMANAEIAAYKSAVAEYENVDWDQLERQDPQAAQHHWRKFTLFQRKLGEAESTLKDAREKREAEMQRINAERFQQSMTEIAKAVPDWGESRAQELRKFATDQLGFTDEEFRIGLHDARQIKMLNMALAATKAKVTRKPAEPPKPAAKVKGGSAPKKGLDDRLSTEEWMKRRQSQLSR